MDLENKVQDIITVLEEIRVKIMTKIATLRELTNT